MAGYYRQTTPHYAKIAALTCKGVTWEWSLAEQAAFASLKETYNPTVS